MRWLSLVLLFSVAPPSFAEEDQGRDLMAEALRLFMRGLLEEMEPAVDGLEGLLDDLSAYHAPEVLPNGDIIIRRKEPLKPEIGEDGEVEL